MWNSHCESDRDRVHYYYYYYHHHYDKTVRSFRIGRSGPRWRGNAGPSVDKKNVELNDPFLAATTAQEEKHDDANQRRFSSRRRHFHFEIGVVVVFLSNK